MKQNRTNLSNKMHVRKVVVRINKHIKGRIPNHFFNGEETRSSAAALYVGDVMVEECKELIGLVSLLLPVCAALSTQVVPQVDSMDGRACLLVQLDEWWRKGFKAYAKISA